MSLTDADGAVINLVQVRAKAFGWGLVHATERNRKRFALGRRQTLEAERPVTLAKSHQVAFCKILAPMNLFTISYSTQASQALYLPRRRGCYGK